MAPVITYVKQTWVDNNVSNPVSAARLGVIEEGILDASQAPAVRVFHNTTQSATSGVALALAFNSERIDQAAGAASTMHDTVTNNSRLTAIYAGVYAIYATVEWAASPVNATIRFRIGGATEIARQQFVGDYRVMNLSHIYAFAVNDYVECVVSQASGGALNVNSTANYSPEFGMVRVG